MNKNVLFSCLLSALLIIGLACNKDDTSSALVKYAGCCGTEPVVYNNSNVSLYIPNAFFPEVESESRFLIFGNYLVRHIYTFQIYDPSNNEVLMEVKNILPNDYFGSWNGEYPDGRPYEGLFYYTSQVLVIHVDTVTSQYYGDTLSIQGNACCIRCPKSEGIPILNPEACAFPSQHNGNGGYQPALPIDAPDCW